jgi:hypothetical protein
MNCDVSLKPVCDVTLTTTTLPDFRSVLAGTEEPAVAPTKEPETVPAKPEVEPEPNTVPYREPVPEPSVVPSERPDTSCPVHR